MRTIIQAVRIVHPFPIAAGAMPHLEKTLLVLRRPLTDYHSMEPASINIGNFTMMNVVRCLITLQRFGLTAPFSNIFRSSFFLAMFNDRVQR